MKARKTGNVLPGVGARSMPKGIGKKPIFAERVIHDGREFVSEALYIETLGSAAYSQSGLRTARFDGLPYLTQENGNRKMFYYNIEDCQRWHLGVAM